MKKSSKIFIVITIAILSLFIGIFIGRNMLPNYVHPSFAQTEDTPSNTNGKVNINIATANELEQLPGIGSKTAANIIEYRDQAGSFQSVDDLLNVEGIGYGTLYKIHELITVGG